ncbi:hypothetical protein BKA63DRAFT_170637 [Paraphoma chrysanthemicola]|nr:hypothetical protein BKA63DRAFT_170637 [Paraphoma chrysanthemicola]
MLHTGYNLNVESRHYLNPYLHTLTLRLRATIADNLSSAMYHNLFVPHHSPLDLFSSTFPPPFLSTQLQSARTPRADPNHVHHFLTCDPYPDLLSHHTQNSVSPIQPPKPQIQKPHCSFLIVRIQPNPLFLHHHKPSFPSKVNIRTSHPTTPTHHHVHYHLPSTPHQSQLPCFILHFSHPYPCLSQSYRPKQQTLRLTPLPLSQRLTPIPCHPPHRPIPCRPHPSVSRPVTRYPQRTSHTGTCNSAPATARRVRGTCVLASKPRPEESASKNATRRDVRRLRLASNRSVGGLHSQWLATSLALVARMGKKVSMLTISTNRV